MNDDMFPQQQLFRLCQATTVNKELLVKLVQDKMMIHGDMERIMAQDSDFDKAHSLYNHLQRRPLHDKPRIIQNLKDTSNAKAASIIEGTEISRDAAMSSLANGLTSLKTDMNEIKQCLNLLMEKVESMDKRLAHTEKVLKTLTNSGALLSRLEESNLTSAVGSLRLSASQSVQKLQTGDSFKQKESPFVLDVSTLPENRGAIVFEGNALALRKRRFWVLDKAGRITFTVVKTDFSPGSFITIYGFKTTPENDCSKVFSAIKQNQQKYGYQTTIPQLNPPDKAYINASTANGTEFTVSGVVILVTLTSNNADSKGLASSFILTFIHEKNDLFLIPGRILQPSTFVTGEGRVVASFPEKNQESYENNADHFMLISRPSERDFELTQTFLDIEEGKHCFRVYSIAEDEKMDRLVEHGIQSGRQGLVHHNWGLFSTVVFFFSSHGSGTGRGYEFTIEYPYPSGKTTS